MKFRLKTGKGSIQEFTDATGLTHKLGEIVDLPESYQGEAYLERVDPPVVVAAAPGKFEPVVPLEATAKKIRKINKRVEKQKLSAS